MTIISFAAPPETLRGAQPGQRSTHLLEHRLRDDLARDVHGLIEVVLPYGRVDVATDQHVIEVEPAAQWRKGVRQALAYSAQCPREPGLALFGAAHRDAVLRIYLTLRDNWPPIALWWRDGTRWEAVSSRRRCNTMRAPLERVS